MLRILGKSSSINVRKVLWTCDELSLAYTREDWGLGFRSTGDAEFLALNPNALVPVLIDEDFVIWESNAIIRYLVAAHGGQALYPADPRIRARMDQWLEWQATDLNNAWRYAFMALVRHSAAHCDAIQIAGSCETWDRYMTILDRQLATTGGHVAGSAFSLADIAIGLSVHRWLKTPLAHLDLPAVRAYYDRLKQRPAFLLHASDAVP